VTILCIMSESERISSGLVEPKVEPESEMTRAESPMIRVCDTPSSTRSINSPPDSPSGEDHSSSLRVSPPASLPLFPPMMIPPMMFLNPYLGLPGLQESPKMLTVLLAWSEVPMGN